MRTVARRRQPTGHAVRDAVGWPNPRDVLAGDVTVIDDDTGLPVIAQVTLPPDDTPDLLRSRTMGLGRRNSGLQYVFETFGSSARMPIRSRESCNYTLINQQRPDIYARLVELDLQAQDAYRQLIPQAESQQLPLIGQVLPEWRIHPDSWWTSGIINHTAALTYHTDGNNFRGSWSAMAVYRDGVRGGMLTIPEYHVTLTCHDRSLVLFQGVELLHGVTPLRLDRPDAWRYSIVFYAVSGMRHCLPCDQELAWARRSRTAREKAPT